MNIGEIMGMGSVPTSYEKGKHLINHSLVGVEVEVENCLVDRLPADVRPWWEWEDDGSLRNNGKEFKFNRPMPDVEVHEALKRLGNFCAQNNMECTQRTGLHVHVDVRDLTVPQLQIFVLLYIIFEQPLFNICGMERASNIFCGSVQDCEGIINVLSPLLDDIDDVDRIRGVLIGQDRAKYSSINLQTLRDLGTVEFRGHKGTYNADEIQEWINFLLSMKGYAVKRALHPTDLLQEVSVAGVLEFSREVFSDLHDRLFTPNFLEDVLDGVRVAQDVVFKKKLVSVNNSLTKKRAIPKDKDLFRRALERHHKEYLEYYDKGA